MRPKVWSRSTLDGFVRWCIDTATLLRRLRVPESDSVRTMIVPDELRYTSDHDWVRLEDGALRIGITDYAQDALGDVVYVEVPELGSTVAANDKVSEVESTKSVSDIYAPVAGTVTAVNTELSDNPDRLNSDPYGIGWICVIQPDDPGAIDALLDAAAYTDLIND